MVIQESSAKPTGTNAGRPHAEMEVFASMELLPSIALVQLDMLVNVENLIKLLANSSILLVMHSIVNMF